MDILLKEKETKLFFKYFLDFFFLIFIGMKYIFEIEIRYANFTVSIIGIIFTFELNIFIFHI